MKELLEKLYEELYAPKLTPYELVQNAKLDNYLYVNMSKIENDCLYVESSCIVEGGDKALFRYVFNQEDHLLTLKSYINEVEETVYDRSIEIKKVKSKLRNLLDKRNVNTAV